MFHHRSDKHLLSYKNYFPQYENRAGVGGVEMPWYKKEKNQFTGKGNCLESSYFMSRCLPGNTVSFELPMCHELANTVNSLKRPRLLISR